MVDYAGNTLGTARIINPSSGTPQVFADRVDSLDTNDYYRFTYSNRSSLSLTLTGLSGDANLQLLNSSGAVLQSSSNNNGIAEVLNAIVDAGTYYIRVFPGVIGAETNYNLTFSTNQQANQPNIFWRDYASGVNSTWGMGGINNTSVAGWAYLPSAAPNWIAEAMGDFNGDGNADIVWRDPTSGVNSIWFMGGTNSNTFLGWSYLKTSSDGIATAASNWSIEGVADFNGDGRPDLLWRDATSGANSLWFMGGTNNTTIIGWSYLPSTSPDWLLRGLADFNGDNRPDIVWRNRNSGVNSIWFMGGVNNTAVTSWSYLPNAAPNWSLDGIVDFNGDNCPDLMWRDYTTGTNSVWFMGGVNNTAVTSWSYLPNAAPNWRALAYNLASTLNPIDSVGNTLTTALNIGVLNGYGSFSDRVDSSDPNDYYQFTLNTSSNLSLNLSALQADADVYILNSAGSTLYSSTNGSTTSESISTTLNAGTYYVRIFQYSGSTAYNLSLTATAVTPQPDLVIQSLSVPTSAVVGSNITISAYTKNNGATTAGYSYVRYWLSDDAVLNTSTDRFLSYNYVGSLGAGVSEYDAYTFTYDASWGTGTKYIFFEADGYSYVTESSETNNTAYQAITINPPQPDLVIQSLSVPTSAIAGSNITISAYTKNNGATTAGYSYVRYWLSDDAVLNTSTDRFLSYNYVNGLSAGASEYDSYTFTYDASWGTGTKYIFFEADGYSYVTESSETNNTAYQAITITSNTIDLKGSSFSLSSTSLTAGNTVTANFGVQNIGNSNAGSFNVKFYLSTDSTITTSDRYLDFYTVSALNAYSATTTLSKILTLPGATDSFWSGSKTYYIGMIVDADGSISESNETNNANTGTGWDWKDTYVTIPASSLVTINNLIFSGNEGTSGTFNLSLSQSISSNVTLAFNAGRFLTIDADGNVGTGTQNTIIFTPTNWNQSRTVLFIAENDDSSANRFSGNTIGYTLSGGLNSSGSYDLGTIINTYAPDTSRFNIDLDFRNDTENFWTSARRTIAQRAANDWANVIANELSGLTLNNQSLGMIGVNGRDAFTFTTNRCIDDLVIFVGSYNGGDNAGGWGGSCPSLGGWTAAAPLPRAGQFTVNALEAVTYSDANLYSIFSHEIGHALGLLGQNLTSENLIDASTPQTAVFRGEYSRIANGGSYIPLQSQDGPNPVTGEYDYSHPANRIYSMMSYGYTYQLSAPTSIDFALLADAGYRVRGVNA